MKKILIIPHHPGNSTVKIRLIEAAKALALDNDVYLLNWEFATNYTFLNRLIANLKDIFKLPRKYIIADLQIVEFPTIHRPVWLARFFNRAFLMRFIEREGINSVINGSYYLFSVPKKKDFNYVVDLADLPAPEYINRYTLIESLKADSVTVVSHGLDDFVRKYYKKESVIIPNGADTNRMREVTENEISALKDKYGLSGKIILGYAGYIGKWVNIELAIGALRLFQKEFPEAVLLWIGAAPDIVSVRKKYGGEDVIFTGPVKDNIELYFRMTDIGILPHTKSPFQDMAFHLKLIEYTAAGKPVVSTELEESVRLGFPNIIFSEENPAAWAEALIKAKNMVFLKEWSTLADKYDWKKIAEMFEKVMNHSIEKKSRS